MSIRFATVQKGRRVFTADGAADPHYRYAAGRLRLVRGRADADPLAAIFYNGKLLPIGGLYGSAPAALRQRDPNLITWEGPLTIPSGAVANQPDGSYLVSGRNFKSTSTTGSPAILNQSTLLVRIENCNVWAFGGSGNATGLIVCVTTGGRMSIKNTIGFSGNPGVAGTFGGRFVNMSYWNFCEVMNCEAYGTQGISLLGYAGSGSITPVVNIQQNYLKNLDGRISAGGSAWRTGQVTGTDFLKVQAVQIDTSKAVNAVIAYNRWENEAGNSRVEDLLSVHGSNGFSSTYPVFYHHNLCRGIYVYDPVYAGGAWYGNTASGSTTSGLVVSGGGGLAGDGTGTDNSYDPAFVVMEDNVVLDSMNYGVGISSGNRHTINRNFVLSSGYVHNFVPDVKTSRTGSPVQIVDYGTGYAPGRWYGEVITNNITGFTYYDPTNAGAQGTIPFGIDTTLNSGGNSIVGTYTASNNTSLGVQTRATVNQAQADWLAARAGEGRIIGVTY